MAFRFFNSLTEMKNNWSSITIGDICETLGYFSSLDGGRGRYLFSSSEENETGDDGYIIKVGNSPLKKATLIIENNEINALQYGAHNDWIQYPNERPQSVWTNYDNRAVFSRMMNRAKEIRCDVYIPKGIYMCIPTKIEDTLLPMFSNLTLRGDGVKTIVTMPTITTGFYSSILKCVGASNFTVRDITFDGNRHLLSNNTYFGGSGLCGVWGIELNSCKNGIFENVTSQNCSYVGFRILKANGMTFNKCRCLNVDCGIISLGMNLDISDIIINSCVVDGYSSSEPISLYQNALGKNIIITNNILKNKEDGIGILVGYQGLTSLPILNDNIIISNNIIENTSVGISAIRASHLNIVGNIITKSLRGYNLLVEYCSDVIVSENQFDCCAIDNINITGSKHLIISNNLIKDNSPQRIASTNSVGFLNLRDNFGISIRNNHIYQTQTNVQKYIRINTGNQNIIFDGNETYHDNANQTIRIWLDGNNNTDCLRNSYIELPPYSTLWNQYSAGMDNAKNHSNVILKRIDEIYTNIYDNNTNELIRTCIIDPIAPKIENIGLKPINTRLLLIFNQGRSYDTVLGYAGNIHFKQNNTIPKNSKCIIELVCLGDCWEELNRT